MDYTYQNYHRHSMYTNVKVPDSVASIQSYADRAKELGQSILSTVEHGWQGNVWESYKAAKASGLKMLVGAEAYWVKDRFEKDKTNCHICVLAKNENGRQALNDVLSEANITGFYNRARLDIPLLLSLPADDIWVTSACLAGWLYEDADDCWYQIAQHFGKNFFLEVQYHNTDTQIALNSRILKLRDKWKVPLIMGCDSHYIHADDAQNRTDFLVSKGINYPEEEGWYLDMPDGETAYQRFAQQGILSHEHIIEAISNTNVFADVEEYDSPIFNTDVKLPSIYPDWTQEQKDAEYQRLVWQGWDEYKEQVPVERWEEYESEIKKEMQVVIDTKMADYFIIDYHVIKQGKANGGWLTKTGRGSAVSFITNMLLGFTEVDRLAAKVHMFPDRFMSTTRILESKSLPDIDMNMADPAPFALAQKQVLGEDHAYPMLAFGSQKVSAAWKLYAKSQGVPFEIANAVSGQIAKYELALKHADEDEKDSISIDSYIGEQYRDLFEKSKEYQGIIVSWSIAPCAYLLYGGSIRREFGLVRIKDAICATIDGHWAEEAHMLKNDLLTVQVVNQIYRGFNRIGMEPPSVNELLKMTDGDMQTWELYHKGCTLCLNQVEKTGTSARVGIYKPTNISELAAFVAAIRPGFSSMYKIFESRKSFNYGVKAFDDLIQTEQMPNSFVLYQEQEMAALNYAGIPMPDCYTAIKNIAKKRVDKVLAYKDKFKAGFTKAMIEQDNKTQDEADILSDKLWQIIEDSSRYSFNCVSGDTKIQKVGGINGRFQPTVAEMYRIMNDKDYAIATGHYDLHKKYRYNGYGTALSMYDDLRIRKNRIAGIYPSGKQQTYTVTTETGKSIVCTNNHRFPTPDGKKMLSELQVGDYLYCKGEYEVNRDKYTFTDGTFDKNYPTKGECGFREHPNGPSRVYNETREFYKSIGAPCVVCNKQFSEDERFELHHRDFNRTNNTPENFMWLCCSCHKKIHYKNNRKKLYDKGIPTYLDKIASIEPKAIEETFDIEMEDPAHTFISENGLVVSNCSHAYCVALDSLYGAWLKAHHPLEFYETVLRIYESKGDKDKMSALKTEAESYFNIKFPPFRYGIDNRGIKADSDKNSIYNSLASIKGFGVGIGKVLYQCSTELGEHPSFIDVLYWLDKHSIKSSKIIPLIKIDYFQEFGNETELLRIVDLFDFFQQGTSKTIKKDKLKEPLYSMVAKYATDKGVKGNELKSFTITDMNGLLHEVESYIKELHLPELTYKVKAENQKEILGYVDLTTGREEDRRKLFVLDVYEIQNKWSGKGGVWKVRVQTKSLGSGKTANLSIAPYLASQKPVHEGDILVNPVVKKDSKGYWNLLDYDIYV